MPFSLDRYSFGDTGFLGAFRGWGYQDFAAGAIVGTAVTLSDNENGDYISFSSGNVINGTAVIVRTPTTGYTETTKRVYTGATAILSSAVEVSAHTSNTSVTLSGIPHASWPCRIYYLYNYTAGIPVNYSVPPKSVTSFLFAELEAMLVTEQELTAGTKNADFASLTAATADINGGTIDGTIVGGTTPAAGGFTIGTFTDHIDINESSIPDTPSANVMRLYAESIQGFPFLSFKDDGGMVRKLVRDSIILVYNDSGSTIAASRIVYASGSSNDVPTIALAKADSSATMPAIGVTIESIADGAFGRVMQVGLLENVNTLAYSAGDIFYVSKDTAGVPTTTAPVWPNLRQEIGTVLADSATVGSIQIVARSVFNDAVVNHDGLLNFVAAEHIDWTNTASNLVTTGSGTFGKATVDDIVLDNTTISLGAPGAIDGIIDCNVGKLTITTSDEIELKPTADTNDYIKISTPGNIPHVEAIGANLHIHATGGTVDFGSAILATTNDISCDDISCAGGTSSEDFVFNNNKKLQFKESDGTAGLEIFCYTDDQVFIDTEAANIPINFRPSNAVRMTIDVTNGVYIGDGAVYPVSYTNYISVATNGDLNFHGTAGFYPRRINQSAIPGAGTGATQIDTGELLMWRDSDDGKVYLVYNDTTSGIKSVELT